MIPVKEFKSLMEALEDMEDIRIFDEAMSVNEPSIPIEEAFEVI